VRDLGSLWDDWHSAKEQFELEATEELPLAWWRETAKRHLPPLDDRSVLDVGCARGGFARDLAQLGARMTAVDISPVAVAHTQAKLDPHGGAAHVADAVALPFETDRFDVTTALETLHHVHDPETVLSELVRVTRPGGQIVLSVENHLSLYGLSALALAAAGRHVSEAPVSIRMTLPRLARAVRRRGCRIAVVEGGNHYFVIPAVGTARDPFLSRLQSARYLAPNVLVVAVKDS
jgi:2-polyprenyl-3-methyl-5-hydroxy-6-metoxy-1,4-benzoquinol methylase